MKKIYLLIGILVIAIVTLVIVSNKKQKKDELKQAELGKDNPQPIPESNIKNVTKIVMNLGKRPNPHAKNPKKEPIEKIVVEKVDGFWKIKEPILWEGDSTNIQAVIDTLNGLKYKKIIKKDEVNLSDIGLQDPETYITFFSGNKKLKVNVGDMVLPLVENYYMSFSTNEDNIYIVETAPVDRLRKTVDGLKNRSVFRLKLEELLNVKVIHRNIPDDGFVKGGAETKEITFVKDETEWIVKGLDKEDTLLTDTAKTVKKIIELRANNLINDKKILQNLSKSFSYMITAEDKNGKKVTAKIYKYIAKDEKEKSQYKNRLYAFSNRKDIAYEISNFKIETGIDTYKKKKVPELPENKDNREEIEKNNKSSLSIIEKEEEKPLKNDVGSTKTSSEAKKKDEKKVDTKSETNTKKEK